MSQLVLTNNEDKYAFLNEVVWSQTKVNLWLLRAEILVLSPTCVQGFEHAP